MNTAPHTVLKRIPGWLGFLVVQLAIVTVAIAATAWRFEQIDAARRIPEFRQTPLVVRPLYDDPRVITDEQLHELLFKLQPRLRGESLKKINHIDHALRFWGADARFDDGQSLSGEEMRQILVNHERFLDFWGDETRPLLVPEQEGIAVRTGEGNSSATHYDHTLAGLAEVGTPLDYEVVTPAGVTTVRQMLEYAFRKFSLNQVEYEWSTLAFVLYLPPTREWISSEGQQITFDRLADRLMRQRLNLGVCMGNHRLHALVMLVRVDDEMPILSAAGRQRILNFLRDVTARFVRHQSPEGFWNRNWPDGTPLAESLDRLDYRIMATGHVLEWWALAPEEVQPPRETVIRGGQWLTRTILELDEKRTHEYYTYLTHAGRALAMWRGDFPAHFITAGLPDSPVKAEIEAPPEPPAESSDGELPIGE